MITDALVQTTLRSTVLNGLARYGQSGIAVLQNFASSTQGTSSAPAIYFTKIYARRYGTQGRSYLYLAPNFDKTERYFIEDTYQFNATIKEDVADINGLTASDIIDLVAGILQSIDAINELSAVDIGIERIQQIRTPRVLNDSMQYREEPSFDCVLVYQRTLTTIVPPALPVSAGVIGV